MNNKTNNISAKKAKLMRLIKKSIAFINQALPELSMIARMNQKVAQFDRFFQLISSMSTTKLSAMFFSAIAIIIAVCTLPLLKIVLL